MGKRSITNTFYFSVVGSEDFMKIYREIFEKNNLVINGHNIKFVKGKKNDLFNLEYGGNNVVKKIMNYLYQNATIYLDRKYEKKQILDSIPFKKNYKPT